MQLSAVIITFNEEQNIARAISSVAWADEVLVVDSESTDRTREIAEKLGAKVIVHPWAGFSDQKQFAANSAKYDWILSIDADEEVSDQLRLEIISGDYLRSQRPAYSVPRLSIYMGRPIRHGGWYPDRQVRLFDRRRAAWNGSLIHESIVIKNGAAGKLMADLYHYSVENAAHHHRMIGTRYAPLAAEQMFNAGRRTSAVRTAVAGPAAFIRSFILKAGLLDGFPGYCIARFAAHHAFLKHLMLYEMQTSKQPAAEIEHPSD